MQNNKGNAWAWQMTSGYPQIWAAALLFAASIGWVRVNVCGRNVQQSHAQGQETVLKKIPNKNGFALRHDHTTIWDHSVPGCAY